MAQAYEYHIDLDSTNNLLSPLVIENYYKLALSTTINLDPGYHWEAALIEVGIVSLNTKRQEISINTDMIKPSYIGNRLLSSFRVVTVKSTELTHYVYSYPVYKPMAVGQFKEIIIYLTDIQGEMKLFTDQPLRLTLHIRRKQYERSILA